MKKRLISYLSFGLALIMLLGAFAACSEQEIIEPATDPVTTESSESDTLDTTSTDSHASGSETVSESDDERTDETVSSDIDTTETESMVVGPQLEGEQALLIENAHALKNGVNAYFPTSQREGYFFENQEMQLEYALKNKPGVSYLANKSGKSYVENTMDVFVTMTNGKTYYASNSDVPATANIFRLGYYYYEMRFEEQLFTGNLDIIGAQRLDHRKPAGLIQCASTVSGGEISFVNETTAGDPQIHFNSLKISTDKYKMLEVTLKADENTTGGQIYIRAGGNTSFTAAQGYDFSVINDGEYHTYRIPLYLLSNYTEDITALRIDVNGDDAAYSIKGINFLEVDTEGLPLGLALRRSFHTYSDKMHHEMQFTTVNELNNVAAVGMVTEIAADTVAKLIVADKDGLHSTLDSVDWASAEYVAFDIIDTGIFGYILPFDGKSGTMEVTLSDGVYMITQTVVPENNTLKVSSTGTNNANDLYMGQRIYTDETHDFDTFLKEAYCERNPLTAENISVDPNYSTNAGFSGYDPIRGIYKFTLPGPADFNASYYSEQNKHYRVNFNIKGDDLNRNIYVMTYTSTGTLECAVLLDSNDVMLPMPLEVGKNFSEEAGDRNMFNLDDAGYGEVIMPMVIKANSEGNEYTLLNVYQNWGQYPLKQLSWIQFSCPYYHFSTGASETNCIIPYYTTKGNRNNLNTLPDFRSMSSPVWEEQPQHNSCGEHRWLEYTDSDGNYVASENVLNMIDSFGPTYADVTMDYISDDGKIKVTYTHLEMPQTDENRTYYEMQYEILEDIGFKDFSRDFKFYSVKSNDTTGIYAQVSYLNENNENVVVKANTTMEPVEYILGNECPYFAFFDLQNVSIEHRHANVGFIIYSSEFIIGGEEVTPNFALIDQGDNGKLSLSLALDEVTLKAGDKFTINAILIPWGSQDSVYDGSNGLAPDQNILNVRNDSCLNPLTVTADANCEKLESVYLPKLKTTNGESAEFTVSGGNNNVAVRVYGFEKMTVPVVYEMVKGKWKPYKLNSLTNPDTNGNVHAYDGYCIYYDGDGTFSYSFVFTMEEGESRSFKIVADGNYEAWEKEANQNAFRTDYLKIYTDHVELGELAPSSKGVGEVMINDEEKYVRIYGTGADGAAEGYFFPYTATFVQTTGQYMVIKYRIPKTNTVPIDFFEIYTSTVTQQADGANMNRIYQIEADGEWHTVVLDLSAVTNQDFVNSHFTASGGEYSVKFLRLDFFSGNMPTDAYIDISYIGMDSDLTAVAKHNSDMEYVVLLEGDKLYHVDTVTGKKETPGGDIPEVFVHPDSEYKQSTLPFVGHIDYLNGTKISTETNSLGDIAIYNFFKSTIAGPDIVNSANESGPYLSFAGWAAVKGGASGYKWSADGGKTWHNAVLYNIETLSDAGSDILTAASQRIGNTYTFTTADAKCGAFQGAPAPAPTGIGADLSEYAGKTVNVILAIASEKNPDELCPILCVVGVKVTGETTGESKENESETETEPEEDKPSVNTESYKRSSLPYASVLDMINARGPAGSERYISRGGNSLLGVDTVPYNSTTFSDSKLVFTGWIVLKGGVSKYIWSVDDGETWQDCILYNKNSYGNASTDMIKSACTRANEKFTEADVAKGNFQSGLGIDPPENVSGIAVDLSEYAGQTVSVLFAAVPVEEPESYCPIVSVVGVQVLP